MLHMMLKDMFHGSLHDTFKISINSQCLKMFIKCTSYNTIMLLINIPLDEYLKMVNHNNILAHSKVLVAHQLIFLITKPNEHLVVFSKCVLHVFQYFSYFLLRFCCWINFKSFDFGGVWVMFEGDFAGTWYFDHFWNFAYDFWGIGRGVLSWLCRDLPKKFPPHWLQQNFTNLLWEGRAILRNWDVWEAIENKNRLKESKYIYFNIYMTCKLMQPFKGLAIIWDNYRSEDILLVYCLNNKENYNGN